MDLRLSILIASLPERLPVLTPLVAELTRQVGDLPVEIQVLLDNRKRTLGAKRNVLIAAAQGEYVTFVDDDDWVEPHYVRDLLDAIARNPGAECIVFDVAFHLNGRFVKHFRYGQEYGWTETEDWIYREPNQWMCWARRVMRRYPYPDQPLDEDSAWIRKGPWKHERIRQARIPAVLYHYRAVPGHT